MRLRQLPYRRAGLDLDLDPFHIGITLGFPLAAAACRSVRPSSILDLVPTERANRWLIC